MKKLLFACLVFCAASHAMDNSKSETLCRRLMCVQLFTQHQTSKKTFDISCANPINKCHEDSDWVLKNKRLIDIEKKDLEMCIKDCMTIFTQK